jgi:hypothetical protein
MIEAPTTTPAGTFVPPPIPELAPLFPQLEILELLGQGGMGAVYKARQIKLDRLVALKVLPPVVANDPSFAERFIREARTMARLNHPHIVAVHDFGDVKDLYYLVMEFVEGVNLRQALAAGKLEPAQALVLVAELCSAMQYAHEMGVVHRDIKPENILLDRHGRVKVADFGLAKLIGQTQAAGRLTASSQAMGTPHYMAPEQWEKPLQVDHRADIYSLGVVFYELLTGELPLGKFAPPSEKAGVDARLDEVVLRAIEKQPEQRYQQMSEMKTAVESVGQPADSSPDEVANQPVPLEWPFEVLVTALMLPVMAAVAAAVWFTQPHLIPEWGGRSVVLATAMVVLGIYDPQANRYLKRLLGFVAIALVATCGSIEVMGYPQPMGFFGCLAWPALIWVGVTGIIRVCFSFSPSDYTGAEDEEEADDSAEPMPGLSVKEEELRQLLLKSDLAGWDWLSVIPNIDDTLLAAARKQARVALDDRVLAVLDLAAGEEGSFMVFGCSGLYWYNGQDTPHPGTGSLSYAELAGRRFVNHGDAVYLGDDQFLCPTPTPDEGGIECDVLVKALTGVRDLMKAPSPE